MNSLARVLQVTLILIASFAALSLVGYLPFYFSYDMDVIVLQDLLLIQSGQLAAHYVHPGLGMNLVLVWIQWLAQTFGFITNVSLDTLSQALQPLVVIAEQTNFLRHLNAIFCILLAVVLWMGFDRLFKKDLVGSTLMLILLLLIPALWQYDILMLRTETYSLLFWSLALFFTVLSVLETDSQKLKLQIRLIGFFAALSFFTKIQSFFLVALLPLLFLLLRPNDQKLPSSKLFPVKKFVIVFLILGVFSIFLPYPSYITTFRSNWLPNKFFVIFLLLLSFIHLQQTGKIKWVRLQGQSALLNDLAEFFKLFFHGAAAVLLVPFFMPTSPITSTVNSLLNFKVIFLRHTEYSDVRNFFLFGNMKLNSIYCIGFFAAIITVLAWRVFKKSNSQKTILVGLVGLVAVIHFSIGARDKIQDAIWVQIPILVILGYGLNFVRSYLRWFLLLLIITVNVFLLTEFRKYTIPQEIAYFDQAKFMTETYQFNQWDHIMKQKYSTELSVMAGLDFANNWSRWKSILANNFPRMPFDLKDVQSFEKNMRIDLKDSRLLYTNTRDTVLSVYTPKAEANAILSQNCHLIKEELHEIGGISYTVRYYGSSALDFKVVWDFDERIKAEVNRNQSPYVHSFKCILSGDSLKRSFVVLKSSLDFYKAQN